MVASADLVIAHNANFDRRFLERLHPVFATKPWACSMSDMDWRAEGNESSKLEYLAYRAGFFYTGHSALMDCFAGIELMTTIMTITKSPAMASLLKRVMTDRVVATIEGLPFALNSALRERGYRFGRNADGVGVWSTTLDPKDLSTERRFWNEIQRNPLLQATNALDRFSDRAST